MRATRATTTLVCAIAFGSLGVSGCSKEAAAERPPTTVSVGSVTERSYAEGQRYTASIEPDTQVVLAFRASGYVDRITSLKGADGRVRAVQAGDVVKKGTVLAVVRQADYKVKVEEGKTGVDEAKSTLEQSEAQVAEARAAYERAKLDFERATALYASQSMTKPDYDAAKAQLDSSKARLDSAQAQVGVVKAKIAAAAARVDEANIALADTQLAAPMDCVVIRRSVEVGSLVGAGAEGFVVADTRTVKAVFGVPDIAVHTLKPGDALTVTSEALPGRTFGGVVSSVAPAADAKSRVFDVEVSIANGDQALKSGMIASLTVADAPAPASLPVVPLNAVVRSKKNPDGYAVFTVAENLDDAVVTAHEVTLGPVYGSEVVVASGVSLGDRVVVTGATLITDGDHVRVIK